MVAVGCNRCARETRAPQKVVDWPLRGPGGGESRCCLGFQEGGGRMCRSCLAYYIPIGDERGDCWAEALVDGVTAWSRLSRVPEKAGELISHCELRLRAARQGPEQKFR